MPIPAPRAFQWALQDCTAFSSGKEEWHTSPGLEIRGKNTGRALAVLTHLLWDLGGDAATGVGNGCEENGNKHWGPQESVCKACQVRFPHKLTETNALKRYFLHSTTPQTHLEWQPPQILPPKRRCQHCSAVRSALQVSGRCAGLGSQQGPLLFALHTPQADI